MNFLDRKLLKAIELNIALKTKELEELETKKKAFLTEVAEKKYAEFPLVALEGKGKIVRPANIVSLNKICDIGKGFDSDKMNGFLFDESLINILHKEKSEHDGLEKVYSDQERSYEVRKITGDFAYDALGIIQNLNICELRSLDEVLVSLCFVVEQIKNGTWPLGRGAVCLGYFEVVEDFPLMMILTCISEKKDEKGYGFWKIDAPLYTYVSHYNFSSRADISSGQRKLNFLLES